MSSTNINNVDDAATLATDKQPEKGDDNVTISTAIPAPERGTAFWLVFFAICLALFVSALDALIVSTALPTIVADLQGKDFIWVINSYNLAATAFLPWTGSLATIFGRKPVILSSLFLFLLGSGLCGGANSMNMLIAGRTIQGLGAGANQAMTEIIVSDLVPVAERGMFFGIIGMVWAVASAVGPPLGGAFAQQVSWRWVFYLNLPLTGLAIAIVFFFLRLHTPKQTFKEKMARMDWIGNILIIGGCTSAIIGLSWAGIQAPWDSAKTLAPIIIGLLTLVAAVVYEAKVPKEPTIPFEILTNRTTVFGYITTALQCIVLSALGIFIPVYFQSCKLASPLQSSVDTLPSAFSIAPAAIVTGASTSILNRYVPQNILGWMFITSGIGGYLTFDVNTSTGMWVGLQFLAGWGMGMLFPATNLACVAPLPLKLSAHALAFYAFIRSFFMVWGATIGSTILQNELKSRLPQEFSALFPGGAEIAYAAIPALHGLDPGLRAPVLDAFAESLKRVWLAMTIVSGVGLLSSLMLKEIPMATVTDEQWGVKEKIKKADTEKGGASTPPKTSTPE